MNASPTQLWELDTRHLGALAAIARTRSFSRAADELGYGQSAVSQQLASLERMVGHRLVDRGTGPRPVTLTAAGAALLVHATWILERIETARRELEQLDAGGVGRVSVGTFQSAGARLLPHVLASYRREWPGIAVSIRGEAADGELSALVRSGALDVAFVETSAIGPGLDHEVLMVDRFVALVPPGHRLASRPEISLAELAGEDLVGGEAGDSCTARGERAVSAAAGAVNVVFRTDDNPTRQRLVDAGLGCAVLPGLTVEPGLVNGAVTIPITEDVHRVICLAWAADRTKSYALERFIEATKRAIAEMDLDRPAVVSSSAASSAAGSAVVPRSPRAVKRPPSH